jgi:hypothetical protein
LLISSVECGADCVDAISTTEVKPYCFGSVALGPSESFTDLTIRYGYTINIPQQAQFGTLTEIERGRAM